MNTCTSRPIALSSGALARAASRADAVRSDSSRPGLSRSKSPMRRVCHPEAKRLVAAVAAAPAVVAAAAVTRRPP